MNIDDKGQEALKLLQRILVSRSGGKDDIEAWQEARDLLAEDALTPYVEFGYEEDTLHVDVDDGSLWIRVYISPIGQTGDRWDAIYGFAEQVVVGTSTDPSLTIRFRLADCIASLVQVMVPPPEVLDALRTEAQEIIRVIDEQERA
jgi:hypothetical protein